MEAFCVGVCVSLQWDRFHPILNFNRSNRPVRIYMYMC